MEVSAKIPLSQIQPAANPRRFFSPAKHEELVASIRLRGVLQPILLRPAGEGYAIVAGERRYRAALEVFGPEGEIPAVIAELTDQQALEAAIDENDIREDASETEQADAAVRVLAACGDDRAEAAKRLGWSTAKLDRRLALAGLSDAVKTALDERRIKVGHAELLAAVPADKQDRALETILSAGIDVAKTRELLQRMTQSLAAATFDKTECAGCGFNSARQKALFETHVEDGHCTNGACYALKVEAAAKLTADVEPAAPAAPEPTAEQRKTEAMEELADREDLRPKEKAAPAKPAAPAAPAKAKVTVESLRTKLSAYREETWRESVGNALLESADHVRVADLAAEFIKARAPMPFKQVTELAEEFEVDLRKHWCINGGLLDQLNKDELKFVAIECGLVAHMGEKAFAKILGQTAGSVAASMLAATGFDWAGRIPSAMSIDGKYGSPLAAEGEGEA